MDKNQDLAKKMLAALLLAATAPAVAQAADSSEGTFLAAGCGAKGSACGAARRIIADNENAGNPYDTSGNSYQMGCGAAPANTRPDQRESAYPQQASNQWEKSNNGQQAANPNARNQYYYTMSDETQNVPGTNKPKKPGHPNDPAQPNNGRYSTRTNQNQRNNIADAYDQSRAAQQESYYNSYNANQGTMNSPTYSDTSQRNNPYGTASKKGDYGVHTNLNRDYNTVNDYDFNRAGTTTSMSSSTLNEAQLIGMLNPQSRAIYLSLDPEAKSLAIQLASQDSYRDKNLAVREAQRRMNERRGIMNR